MKKSLALLSSLTVAVLAGCASQVDRVTASGSYDYLKSKERTSMKVPSDLDRPEFSDDYELPKLGENADQTLVGKKLVIQSPALVLPLVAGSHVEEGSRSATVWFDQVDDSQPLSNAVWDSLINYLDKQGIGVDSFDPEAGVLVTDWAVLRTEDEEKWYQGWYSWDEEKVEVGRRFKFTLQLKPHGRTAALSAELVDYMVTKGEEVKSDIDDIAQRREEVAILNSVISHYEYENQVKTNQRIAQIRQGLTMNMGFDEDGNPAFVVDAQYDIAWPRLLLVLRKLGFNVKDLDKSNGLLFVTYTDEQSSWWKGVFSSDAKKLLEYDDYHLVVGDLGNKTSITFKSTENEPFEANVVSNLYDSFVRVMSEDNLDI